MRCLRCWPLRGVLSNWASLLLVGISTCGAIVAGCGPQMPAAEYSSFGDPGHSWAWISQPTRTVPYATIDVWMNPREAFSFQGLSIQEFHSPTGSRGDVVIWDAKGRKQLRLTANLHPESEMIFKWKVAQKGRVVQDMQVRILPGPPVRVFVNAQEIDVALDQ